MLTEPKGALDFRRLGADCSFVGLEKVADCAERQMHRLLAIEQEIHTRNHVRDRRGPDRRLAGQAIRRRPPADPLPELDGKSGEFSIQVELAELRDQRGHVIKPLPTLGRNTMPGCHCSEFIFGGSPACAAGARPGTVGDVFADAADIVHPS
jgi:hypothetical protein